jgi:hypothetical protein
MPQLMTFRARTAVLAAAFAALAASAHAETVRLECTKADETQNICDSRWVIDGDAKTVTWHWCESPDTTEVRNVEITDDQITFDEAFMLRHYVFNRKTGRMTITAVGFDANGQPGERFEDGVSVCKAPD